ncbi:hypothetical protein CEXT_340651 [Caerostris extrusa]|uniref:Uncharacterized protein n=1 Tax=Caerostris extrusa TaxID=172846 RepID=A0AAV4TFJ5_CAEEX|nr:hypothetical protein CEXT_340651 [Caerostris extrusa]
MKLQSICSYIFNPRSFPTFKNIRKYQHIIRYFTDLLKLKYFVTFIEKSSVAPPAVTYSMGTAAAFKACADDEVEMLANALPLLTPGHYAPGKADCAELAIKKRAASKVLYQQRIGKWRSERKQFKNRKKGRKHCRKKKKKEDMVALF